MMATTMQTTMQTLLASARGRVATMAGHGHGVRMVQSVPLVLRRTYTSKTTASGMHATTILTVRKGRDVVVIGDGQVSLGMTVVKSNARKVRVIGNNKVIAGFAGSTADCFTLIEYLEQKLEQYPGQLLRAGVELAKMWRTDKYLRHLEAWAIAVDKDVSITLTGNGDVLSEPENGIIGIGSGGLYAVSAARALIDIPGLSAREIAIKSMNIAADICTGTNHNFVIEQFRDGKLLTVEEKQAAEREDRELAEKLRLAAQSALATNDSSSASSSSIPAATSTPSESSSSSSSA